MAMNPKLLRPLATLDPDVAAFRAASGATNVTGLNRLAVYLKGQSLWDYARFYPMKSSQNAGSGSTVYGLGGLTSSNMTLVNSPTWGSDGVTFTSASTQYGNLGDVFDGGAMAVFGRVAFTAEPTLQESLVGVYASGANKRSFIVSRLGNVSGDPFRFLASTDGVASSDYRSSAYVSSTDMECIVATVSDSGSVSLYQDKQSRSISLYGGIALTTAPYNSDLPVFFSAYNSGGADVPLNFSDLIANSLLFMSGAGLSLTTTQRETITDLINAL